MISDAQIQALEAAARSWAGTPFCEGSPIKGVGVSCHHCATEIWFESGLMPRVEIPNGPSHYSPANPRSLIAEWAEQSGYFVRIGAGLSGPELVRLAQPGDGLGFRVVNAIHHAAIALRGGRMVHSILGHGVQIAPAIPYAWERRLERVWRLKTLV